MTNVLHKIGTSAGPFSLTIDYKSPLAELVVAGSYDAISPAITEEHFPVGWGQPDIEAFLVHFYSPTSSNNAVGEMVRHDLRPATMPELLAFGAQHPSPQCEFPILALGSIWEDPSGYSRAGRIFGHPSDRRLDLGWEDGSAWNQLYRFLAVQKRICETFPLSIDHGKSLADMVESGSYSYVGRGVREITDVAGVGGTEAILVHLGRVMDNGDVLHELDRRGLRPGKIRELAAFGEQYPDRQRDFPILALGSVYGRRVGCLWLHGDRRSFHLNIHRDRWAANYRFLAFDMDPLRNGDSSRRREDRLFRPFDATLEWIERDSTILGMTDDSNEAHGATGSRPAQ